jgi:hypothetical protein
MKKILTNRREILLLGSVRESIMTPSKTSSEKNSITSINHGEVPYGLRALEPSGTPLALILALWL